MRHGSAAISKQILKADCFYIKQSVFFMRRNLIIFQ
jgi:hypothetical protein